MTEREKLIELIFASGCVSGFAGSLADYLIVHGVRICTFDCDLKERLEDDGK